MAYWNSYFNGPVKVSDNMWAYLQPDGSWGLNNTCILASGDETFMVDAGMDVPRTAYMIHEWAGEDPRLAKVDHLVVTHWHVDHVVGLAAPELAKTNVIATKVCADYMEKNPPDVWWKRIQDLDGLAKKNMDHAIGIKFDFSIMKYRKADTTFEGRLEQKVGGKTVEMVEVAPCHTLSDVIVNFPEEKIAHCGDLVASERHCGLQYPHMSNLIDALEQLKAFKADTYVPGHGPLLTREDMQIAIDYLRFLQDQSKALYDKGLSHEDAALELIKNLGPYKKYRHPDRLYGAVRMMYCEFAGDTEDFARKNYSEYLASAWTRSREMPQAFPELYSPF